MWNLLKAEVTERFDEVELFFRASRHFKRAQEQTARGMAFVHAYAAYEFTVKAVVRTAVQAIIAHKVPAHELHPALLALFLDAELKGVRDCDKKNVWEKRAQLFEKLFSDKPASVYTSVFPDDGTHYKFEQLKTVFRVLGIKRNPVPRLRHTVLVGELVNNRNQVSHGHESAASLGRGYTRSEVTHFLRKIRGICNLLVSAAATHCSNPARLLRRR